MYTYEERVKAMIRSPNFWVMCIPSAAMAEMSDIHWLIGKLMVDDKTDFGGSITDGGTMLAAEISLCVSAEYRARHRAMVEIQRIEAPPHPPYKWD